MQCFSVCIAYLFYAPTVSTCSPEFLNRLDEIIVFRQLTKQEVKQIADIMLKQVFTRAEEKGIKIDVTGALQCAAPAPLLVLSLPSGLGQRAALGRPAHAWQVGLLLLLLL